MVAQKKPTAFYLKKKYKLPPITDRERMILKECGSKVVFGKWSRSISQHERLVDFKDKELSFVIDNIVKPKRCITCKFYTGECSRFPEHVKRRLSDTCGEYVFNSYSPIETYLAKYISAMDVYRDAALSSIVKLQPIADLIVPEKGDMLPVSEWSDDQLEMVIERAEYMHSRQFEYLKRIPFVETVDLKKEIIQEACKRFPDSRISRHKDYPEPYEFNLEPPRPEQGQERSMATIVVAVLIFSLTVLLSIILWRAG